MYKRLTDSETAVMLKNTEGSSWDSEDMDAQRYIRLAELEDKIENGTLIELPCPFGTAIYYLNCNQHDGWWIDVVKFDFRYLSSIGKYAFLTKAEAEQKLKELQEQDK